MTSVTLDYTLLLQQRKYPESHVMQCIRWGKSPEKKVSHT